MREAKRWDMVGEYDLHIGEHQTGDFVLYEDYAALERQLSEAQQENERMRTELEKHTRECPTCSGSGLMDVVVRILPPYEEEEFETVTCAECNGTGISWVGQIEDERNQLMKHPRIEWAEKVWNPITGCTKISPGCANCYAERMAKRLAGRCGYPAVEPFRVTLHDDMTFVEPLKWRKPTRCFVCSMGDLFHEDVPDPWIDGVFAAMGLTYDIAATDQNNVITAFRPRHIYMLLTKRPERMRSYVQGLIDSDWDTLRRRFHGLAMGICDIKAKAAYLPHLNASMEVAEWIKDGMPGLWLGVTAENQEMADQRIPILLQIPAAVRFVSVEPMLGPVNLRGGIYGPDWLEGWDVVAEPRIDRHGELYPEPVQVQTEKLDWVICGGESGPGARPMHPDWARSLRDQCQAAGVPYYFKQWGEWFPRDQWEYNPELILPDDDIAYDNGPCTHVFDSLEGSCPVHWVGKHAAGRLLDGQTWDQMPEEVRG
jgi:protein gp37